MFEFGVELNTL